MRRDCSIIAINKIELFFIDLVHTAGSYAHSHNSLPFIHLSEKTYHYLNRKIPDWELNLKNQSIFSNYEKFETFPSVKISANPRIPFREIWLSEEDLFFNPEAEFSIPEEFLLEPEMPFEQIIEKDIEKFFDVYKIYPNAIIIYNGFLNSSSSTSLFPPEDPFPTGTVLTVPDVLDSIYTNGLVLYPVEPAEEYEFSYALTYIDSIESDGAKDIIAQRLYEAGTELQWDTDLHKRFNPEDVFKPLSEKLGSSFTTALKMKDSNVFPMKRFWTGEGRRKKGTQCVFDINFFKSDIQNILGGRFYKKYSKDIDYYLELFKKSFYVSRHPTNQNTVSYMRYEEMKKNVWYMQEIQGDLYQWTEKTVKFLKKYDKLFLNSFKAIHKDIFILTEVLQRIKEWDIWIWNAFVKYAEENKIKRIYSPAFKKVLSTTEGNTPKQFLVKLQRWYEETPMKIGFKKHTEYPYLYLDLDIKKD